ncbi:MAG: DUF1134 domain-containing protein [Hyphomonadaceae bacterium]
MTQLPKRAFLLGLAGAPFALAGCAATPQGAAVNNQTEQTTYTQDEIINAGAEFLGTTAAAMGQAIERVFREQGRPNAYIKGEEAAGAFVVGLRYGQGVLSMKLGPQANVYWQGPSVGFDAGGNASKCFTLVYNLPEPEAIFQRFPGVDGSAYFIGGIGVNYQQAGNVVLAPMRVGVGLRAGASVGYLAYTKERRVLPF